MKSVILRILIKLLISFGLVFGGWFGLGRWMVDSSSTVLYWTGVVFNLILVPVMLLILRSAYRDWKNRNE